jgi:membrane associated rhomboid family serine protease
MSQQAPSAWSPSGFYGAPVTKAACLCVVAAHVAAARLFPDALALATRPLLSPHNLAHAPWRVPLGACTFATLGEVLWALPVLYTFRELERRMGSRKFSAFALLSTATVLATQIGLMHVFTGHELASGPYGLIFGLFACYFATIPKLSPQSLSLFGVHFSDKSFTYVMGVQLAMSGWSRGKLFGSLASASAGLAFGLLYMAEILPLHQLRLPASLGSLFGKAVMPWFGSSSPWESRIRLERARQERQRQAQQRQNQRNMTPAQLQQYQQQVQRQQQQMQQQQQQQQQMHAAQQASMQGQMPVVEPTPENIAQIVAMGFTEERAAEALRSTQNNVEAAVGRLLG